MSFVVFVDDDSMLDICLAKGAASSARRLVVLMSFLDDSTADIPGSSRIRE